MKTCTFVQFLFMTFLFNVSFSQDSQIRLYQPEFRGNELLMHYDILNAGESDLFYVWVEIQNKRGEVLRARALTGDVGENIEGGTNKLITWIPGKDSVFVNEELLVEVKAEKYVRSFNRGSMMLLSAALPGLGQTMISKGKPWWLAGVASYGMIAGGLLLNGQAKNTYDSYLAENDPAGRNELYNKAQQQKDLSGALIISGTVLWAANIIWVAVIPVKYRLPEHANLSINKFGGMHNGTTLITMKINF